MRDLLSAVGLGEALEMHTRGASRHCSAAVMASSSDESLPVWKAQQVNFSITGYNATYSCRSLEANYNRSVGARQGDAITGVCDQQHSIARFQISFNRP